MTWCLPYGCDTKHLPNGNCSICGKSNDYESSLKELVEKSHGDTPAPQDRVKSTKVTGDFL